MLLWCRYVGYMTNGTSGRVDKQVLRTTMLGLETERLAGSRSAYQRYLESARLDRSEPRDAHDFSQALQGGYYAAAFDAPIHAHEEAIELISALDFGEADVVRPGAVVTWMGQNFVISVLTDEFECQGQRFMGVSCDAPITAALLGKSAGARFELANATHQIDDVY